MVSGSGLAAVKLRLGSSRRLSIVLSQRPVSCPHVTRLPPLGGERDSLWVRVKGLRTALIGRSPECAM